MNRRDFLKTAAALSAAASIPIKVAFAGEKQVANECASEVRYGNAMMITDWPPPIKTIEILKQNAKETVGNRKIEIVWKVPGTTGRYDPYAEFGMIAWKTV